MSPEATLSQTKPSARVEFDGKNVSLPIVEGTDAHREALALTRNELE